ncbi:MAG: efflux RND transporter permease subunit, partial [Bdellovibrionales bacterium]|nr:efflux RND transporter permease subunit [Bdellovibrionales bacterium]
MRKLIEASVLRPVFAWMLMASMIVFGALSFRSLGVSQLPDVDFPYVNVSLNFEGAAPEVMELDVIEPVESALMGVDGIRTISSTARSGVANISVEFEIEKNIDIAIQEVQSKLGQVQRVLPSGIEPPIVTKSNPEDQPILWLSVSSKTMQPAALMAYVRDNVRDDFTKLPGVSDVNLGGYVDPAVRVWVDPKKLRKYALSILDVVKSIQTEQKEFPSGRFESGTTESNVRTLGEVIRVDDLGDLQITRRGGQPIYAPLPLKSVATVEMGLDEVRRRARAMGNPAVGLGIKKQRGENSVAIARAVRAQMEKTKAKLPEGLDIGINFDTTTFIDDSIHELILTIALAAILTSLVCWLFLGTWTSTFNVILAIPTSLLATFLVLRFFNFTLNTFTLLALSLAVGIVVDDAIMVLENIFRHKEMGKTKVVASLDGANEISFAALVATLAIIAIFLPVAFMDGLIGKYFFQFGVALSAAVAFSLIEAITLTPMRCGQFLTSQASNNRFVKSFEAGFARLQRAYERVIPVVLKHRWKTLLAGIAV